MKQAAINSNINYYRELQKKYAALYEEALRQEILLLQKVK